MTDEEFVDRLREMAIAYDRENGDYLESKYQGFDVYEWVRCRLLGVPITEDTKTWSKEVGKK